ncbi:hypothetical protein [Winogradskyella sp.]|uniref:hypothetical protein n=1 Tax=Winogradskyella sp. TaxID=1883156 RepID=UPI00261A7B4A|nr:hypothetical protein [Winogradskyella sp.]
MIDFVRFVVEEAPIRFLEQHKDLDFIEERYCELPEENGGKGFIHADFKSLRIKICSPMTTLNNGLRIKTPNAEPYVVIEGSLHKYWNELNNRGSQNYNDFGIEGIIEVLEDLEDRFRISPERCTLKQVELGVNIQPPDDTKKILQHCFLHKTKELKWTYVHDEGSYKQAVYNNHIIKIYDKSLHYSKLGKNIKPTLRFEIKFKRMRWLNENGVYTLWDLVFYGLHKFELKLAKEWNNILFYDYNVLDIVPHQNDYCNPNYWQNLLKTPHNFKYHRDKLKKLIGANPHSIKSKMAEIIEKKWKQLFGDTSQITSYYIRRKQLVDIA